MLLLEIVCGEGHFLEHLHRKRFSIVGLDPTYEGKNSAIIKEYFGVNSYVRGDAIVLRHVLEHVEDPVAFLMSIKAANDYRGLMYIEITWFNWICKHRAWFDIFYEHVNYFRLADFKRIFGDVRELGRTFGGRYWSVVTDLESLRNPDLADEDPCVFPSDFVDSVDMLCQRFKARQTNSTASIEPQVVVWGGASKGVIFSLFFGAGRSACALCN